MQDKAGNEQHTDRTHVTVMSFNVFAGSPLPQLGHGTLTHSRRLREQLEQVKRIDPDVLCLQEVYDERVLNSYQDALQATHSCMFHSKQSAIGVLAWCGIVGLAGSLTSIVVYFTLAVLTDWQTVVLAAITAFAAFGAAGLVCIRFRFSTLRGFLCGRVEGALATFYRRSMFDIAPEHMPRTLDTNIDNNDTRQSDKKCGANDVTKRHFASHLFRHQKGDPINVFRKRGFTGLFLQLRSKPGTCKSSGTVPFFLANVHTNSGMNSLSELGRVQQVREAMMWIEEALELRTETRSSLDRSLSKVDTPLNVGRHVVTVVVGDFNAQPDATSVALLKDFGYIDGTSMLGPTWDNTNTMTASGLRRIPDEKVDYIFHRDTTKTSCVSSSRLCMNVAPFTSDHFGVLCTLSFTHDAL